MRMRMVAFLVAPALSACGLLVDIGEHHLRDEVDASGDSASMPDTSVVDVPPDAPVEAPPDDGPSGHATDIHDLATNQPHPSKLIGDNGALYWFNEGDGARPPGMMRVLRSGGETVRPATTEAFTSVRVLRLDHQLGYFFLTDEAKGLYRLPRASTEPEPTIGYELTDGTWTFEGLAVTASNAFTTGRNGGNARIFRTSIAPPTSGPNPGASCTVFTAPNTTFPLVVATDPYLYYVDSSAKAIMRSLKACNQPSTELAVQVNQDVTWLGVNNVNDTTSRVYYRTVDGCAWSFDSDTLTPKQYMCGLSPVGSIIGDPVGAAKAAPAVYVADAKTDGNVWRVSEATGEKTLLVAHQNEPFGLVFFPDFNLIYWTNRGSGEVRRATP